MKNSKLIVSILILVVVVLLVLLLIFTPIGQKIKTAVLPEQDSASEAAEKTPKDKLPPADANKPAEPNEIDTVNP